LEGTAIFVILSCCWHSVFTCGGDAPRKDFPHDYSSQQAIICRTFAGKQTVWAGQFWSHDDVIIKEGGKFPNSGKWKGIYGSAVYVRSCNPAST
jgi:hypothetical protein